MESLQWTVGLSNGSDLAANYLFPGFCLGVFLKFLIMTLGHCF